MFLHVGLGNPGSEHKLNRHNIGFMAIDHLLNFYKINDIYKNKFNGHYYKLSQNNRSIFFLKPQTFMNQSGSCVSSLIKFFSIKPSSVIVWHDEIDLDKGKIKVKFGGGHGGHNGIRDIIRYIGEDFLRVRIGVGRPDNNIDPSKWVLSSFHKNDFDGWVNDLLSIMASEVELLHLNNSIDFMNKVSILRNKLNIEIK